MNDTKIIERLNSLTPEERKNLFPKCISNVVLSSDKGHFPETGYVQNGVVHSDYYQYCPRPFVLQDEEISILYAMISTFVALLAWTVNPLFGLMGIVMLPLQISSLFNLIHKYKLRKKTIVWNIKIGEKQ